jgi:hypothetical protein
MNMLKNKLRMLKIKFYEKQINIREKFKSKLKYIFSENPRKANYNVLFIFPILYIPQIAYMADEEKEEKQNLNLEMKDIVRGEYENKIRTFSSIEKRFLIFAKIKKFGDFKMTHFQLLDSLVPFQYIKTMSPDDLAKQLNENNDFLKVMKKIDINGDGFINFEEFIVLSVFMTVPISEYLLEYPSGKITREQLAEFLMKKISKIEALKITNKSLVDGRIIKTDYNTLFTYIVDFIALAFKNMPVDINKEISQFLFEIFLMILFYEFYRIPQTGENKISNENFARVLMSYVNIYKNKLIKKKIEEKLINLDGDITFDEYICFFWFLKCLQNEKMEVFRQGELSFAELKKLSNEKLKTLPTTGFKIKKGISDKQLHILIDLLDNDGKFIYF